MTFEEIFKTVLAALDDKAAHVAEQPRKLKTQWTEAVTEDDCRDVASAALDQFQGAMQSHVTAWEFAMEMMRQFNQAYTSYGRADRHDYSDVRRCLNRSSEAMVAEARQLANRVDGVDLKNAPTRNLLPVIGFATAALDNAANAIAHDADAIRMMAMIQKPSHPA